MEKGVTKFLNYLDNTYTSMDNEFIKLAITRQVTSVDELDSYIEEHVEIGNIARLLKIPKSEWEFHGEIFIQFDILSKYMSRAKLNTREQIDVINHMLHKNLETGITKYETSYFDGPAIGTYNFKYITNDEAEQFIKTDKYRELLIKQDKTEKEKQILEDLTSFIEEHPAHYNDVTDNHREIEKFYESELSLSSIDSFINCLLKFNLDPELATRIKNILIKQIPQVIETPKEIKPKSPVIKKETISKKETYNLEQILKQYIDLNTLKIITVMSYEDLITCLSIFKKLGYSNDKCNQLIDNYIRDNNKYHVIVQFMNLCSSSLSKTNDIKVKRLYDNIIECIQNMIICSKEDYESWKLLLEEEFIELKSQLPKVNYMEEVNKRGL